MIERLVLSTVLVLAAAPYAAGQDTVRYRSAVVALADEPELRAEFERGLVAKAREHDYDAVTSYDFAPDVHSLDDDGFVDLLDSRGVQAVLMLRPASIGAGSSLEAVRNEVSPELFANMESFAKAVSSTGGDALIAVVHMAIYTISPDGATLLSAGAVWLDEDVSTQAEGIDRLQDLIVYNVDAVRPAIRRHLGLPPL